MEISRSLVGKPVTESLPHCCLSLAHFESLQVFSPVKISIKKAKVEIFQRRSEPSTQPTPSQSQLRNHGCVLADGSNACWHANLT
jgi:hypothetical protein